jgi:hypothetical protein
MSEFNDPDLRNQLGRLSGPYPDDNAAFAAWQRRVGQARRRRTMAWTTGAALSLIVGTVAVAAVQDPAQHSVVPQKSSETSTQFSVTVASTVPATTDPSTTASTVPATTASTTLAPETTPTSAVVEALPPPEAAGDDGSGGQGGGSTNGRSTPTSAAKPSKSSTQSFDSPGGSIAVRVDGDELTLVATNPAAGFRARENDGSGRKIEVTFRSRDEEFELTVRLSDGVMKSTVVDKSDRHHDTVPDDTYGGGHGGGGGGGDGSSGSGGGDDDGGYGN